MIDKCENNEVKHCVNNEANALTTKHNWEIKKLGEVCEIVGGSTPKTNEASYWDGNHYWVTPAELNGSKYISSTNRTITDEGVKSAHLQLLPLGTVLLSSRAPIGKVAITTTPMYCNQGFKNLVCTEKLNNEFAYWFLFHNTEYLNSLGTGATFKEISKRVVEQIPIPIPPLAEQEKIVEELDCLNGIIEKKKEQLKELDLLAQSIFYTMFGDPISNEKGWEVKKLGEVCYKIGDGLHGTPKYDEDGEVAFINGNNLIDGRIVITDRTLFVNDIEAQKYKIGLNTNTILLSINGTLGRTAIYRNENIILGKSACYCDLNNAFLITKFVEHLMNSLSFKGFLEDNSSKSTIKNVGLKAIRNYEIILPPLSFQQEFATKIEAIEKQKGLIKESIKETETLLNARMQYYFG